MEGKREAQVLLGRALLDGQKKEVEKEKKKTGEVGMPLKLLWMALREKRKK